MEIHPKLDFDEVLWGLLKGSDAEDAKALKHMEIHPKLDFDEVLRGLLKDSDAEDAKALKHTYGKCIEFCRTKYNGKREVFVHINTENGSCHIDVDPDVENLQCRKIDFIILTLEKIAKELKKYDSDCTLCTK